MSVDEKIVEKIADAQFDWYARLLPGAIAVCYYFYISTTTPTVSLAYLAVYTAVAYLAGHITQPLSELIVRQIQEAIKTDEFAYTNYKKQYGRDHLSSLVNKAFAEAQCMLSSAILILSIMFYMNSFSTFSILSVLYFVGATFERVSARKRKISQLS